MTRVTCRCQPVQARTSYSSSLTSPFAASKQASTSRRVPATRTRSASVAPGRRRQVERGLVRPVQLAPDQRTRLPARVGVAAAVPPASPVVEPRPFRRLAGAQPAPALARHPAARVARPALGRVRRAVDQRVALAAGVVEEGPDPAGLDARPAVPEYCRCTPADLVPFLTSPVPSSASTAPGSPGCSTTYVRGSPRSASASRRTRPGKSRTPSGARSPAAPAGRPCAPRGGEQPRGWRPAGAAPPARTAARAVPPARPGRAPTPRLRSRPSGPSLLPS